MVISCKRNAFLSNQLYVKETRTIVNNKSFTGFCYKWLKPEREINWSKMKNRKKTVDLYVPDIKNSKHVDFVLEIVIETS